MGAVGFFFVLVAAVGWGSNFVVTKGFDMGDGMHFQQLMTTGVIIVAYLTLLFAKQDPHSADYDKFPLPDLSVTMSTQGLLGGFVWTLGNLLTVPILQRIGLGLGMSIWGGTSVVLSFLISRVPIFGLKPDELHSVAVAFTGAGLGVLSLVVFSQVKPNAAARPSGALTQGEGEIAGEGESLIAMDASEEGSHSASEKRDAREHRKGLMMALFAGTMFGFQFVPNTIHGQQYPWNPQDGGEIVHEIRFIFSQFSGIFLTSLFAFLIYLQRMGSKAFLLSPAATLWSIVSGMVWAIACMSSMVAISELGLGIGAPLSSNGAFLVNSAWSLFYFKEVTGARNVRLFYAAGFLNVSSCICLAYARS